MMMRESRDVKPILFKAGLALTLSIVGYLFSRIRIRRINSSSDSSSVHSDQSSGYESDISISSDKTQIKHLAAIKRVPRSSSSFNNFTDAHLQENEESVIKKVISSETTPRLKIGSPPKSHVTQEKDDYGDREMKNLKNIIRMIQERETSLEVRLLEYCDVREKEKEIMELQSRLAISNAEAKMFDLKVENLMSENRRLEAKMADHAKLVAELERSKAKAKLLKTRIKHEAAENSELIRNLQQRVLKLQEDHKDADSSYEDSQMKLKDLENEIEELKKANLRLQIENSELTQRLDSTQILANAFFEDPQRDALKEESDRLKQEKESLTKEIEQLQADRCSDVEELVYLRWINACLRYELRNYQPPPGKTVARDLSKSLSPTSEEKAKQLILEYAKSEGTIMDFDSPSDQWSSFQASSSSSFTDADDSFSPFGNSSSSSTTTAPRIHTSNKNKFFHKLRRLIKGKDHHRVQLSPGEKYGSSQDSDSPQFCSSSVSTANDTCQRSDFDTTPYRISRSSSDFQRLMILKEEEGRENSDIVNMEKTPLMKYAGALKYSGASSTPKRAFGRKSASYSSF